MENNNKTVYKYETVLNIFGTFYDTSSGKTNDYSEPGLSTVFKLCGFASCRVNYPVMNEPNPNAPIIIPATNPLLFG